MKRGIRITLTLLLIVSIMTLGMIGCGKDTTTTEPTTTEPTTPEDVIELRWSSPFPPNASPTIVGNYFCDIVEQETEGRVQIERYPSGELGSAMEHMDMVQSGSVDMATFIIGMFPQVLPLHSAVTTTPDKSGVFGGTPEARESGARLVHELYFNIPEVRALLDAEEQNAGVKVFQLINVGAGSILTKEPISSIDDLDGLSVSSGGPAQMILFEALGMIPENVDIADFYEYLSRGGLDASLSPIVQIRDYRLYEVADSIIGDGSIAQTMPMVVNLDVWNSLPADVQEAFWKANDEAVKYANEIDQTATEDAIQVFEESGIQIGMLPEDELERFWDLYVQTTVEQFWLQGICIAGGLEEEGMIIWSYLEPMLAGTYEYD